jgi:AmmeMemoRadiSam system protein A
MSPPPPNSPSPAERSATDVREASAAESSSSKFPAPEFSKNERALLLRTAHDAILSSLAGRETPLDPPTPHLAEPRGVFTTLHLHGELRGCVGYVLPVHPLYQTVIETARAAAFGDTRFPSVSLEEAPRLQIELSVLTVPKAISPEAIEIGRHGLIVSMNLHSGMRGHRGLLLPQVASEHGWDRVAFLEQTCRKAGLPPDSWKNGATIEAFTAEIFGDDQAGSG